jgi:hypothetical protein
MITKTEAAIWGRLIKPEKNDLAPPAARALLRLNFPASDLDRMNRLAKLARAGEMNDGQRSELDIYLRVGHLLTLMHSKARRALQ